MENCSKWRCPHWIVCINTSIFSGQTTATLLSFFFFFCLSVNSFFLFIFFNPILGHISAILSQKQKKKKTKKIIKCLIKAAFLCTLLKSNFNSRGSTVLDVTLKTCNVCCLQSKLCKYLYRDGSPIS